MPANKLQAMPKPSQVSGGVGLQQTNTGMQCTGTLLSPLSSAAYKGHDEVVRLLLEEGLSSTMNTGENYATINHCCIINKLDK